VFRCLWRAENDKFSTFLLDQFGEVFASVRRHVPCATVLAFVVTHAGPIVSPSASAFVALIKVKKPRHEEVPSRSEAIVAPRNEIDESSITQILELLANLRLNVLVAWVEVSQMSLERIDLVEVNSRFLSTTLTGLFILRPA
jgi:hypothetical protein